MNKKRLIRTAALTDEQKEKIRNLTKQIFTKEHYTNVMENDTKHFREEDSRTLLPLIRKKFKNIPVSKITQLDIIRYIQEKRSVMLERNTQIYCRALLIKEVAEKALNKTFSVDEIYTGNNEINEICRIIQETLGKKIDYWQTDVTISEPTVHYLDYLSREILDEL